MSKRSKCCIIGIPDHQAVLNVGGRIGSARGPAEFRKIFSTFKGKNSFRGVVHDLGDVLSLTRDVEANHLQASDLVFQGQRVTGFSVVVGGGHDHGFSHLRGILAALRAKSPRARLGCINIDAHFDVRSASPVITSGSPFYLALESGVLDPKRFVEFGIQTHCNSPELWQYIADNGVSVVPFNRMRSGQAVDLFQKALKKLALACDAIVISLDLDAVASSYAPGVSAPQSEGFTAMEVISMMEISGREKKVCSLGIFELNPEHDEGARTARLAATAAYHFIESALF
jgi:formiminoglutamase